MPIQLVDLPATRVAYLRKIGPYGASVAAFWREVFEPWLAEHGLQHAARYGIPYDDRHVTNADKCRFDAAVQMPEKFAPDKKAVTSTLPGGRYAVMAFDATPATIGDAWLAMFRGWLPSSGMQCDARPLFAYYAPDSRIDPATGIFPCQLRLRVCPL